MNIKITYNWLLDLLETDASPGQIQKYLSLCGPSVERVEKLGDDFVFDIEITSNRVDTASVLGIAQECTAILPQFGKKAKLKKNLLASTFRELPLVKDALPPLIIAIRDSSANPRFTAMVIRNVNLRPSPTYIQQRLRAVGERPINNLIDISNYLMLELGQPSHIFDYDTIKDHMLTVQRSHKGETVTTLDGESHTLPGGDIVIEDGSKSIIDLCGIMGGRSSAVTDMTKNIVVFVQTYDKQSIRKTSMTLGKRSVAATYFEKGLDPQRVEPTFVLLVQNILKYAGGQPASKVYDIFPRPTKPGTIRVSYQKLIELIGTKVPLHEIEKILRSLSFTLDSTSNDTLVVTPPSYRTQDVTIWQDVTEEVARIYGYHTIPSHVQITDVVKQPKEIDRLLQTKHMIRTYLADIGLHEVYNYSMIAKTQIERLKLDETEHLRLSNTISTDIEYLRTTLMPSLVKNITDNEGKGENLQFFELARAYKKVSGDLPIEEERLGIVVTNDFFRLKGILEALFDRLHVSAHFRPSDDILQLTSAQQAVIHVGSDRAGYIGEVRGELVGTKLPIYIVELSLVPLVTGVKGVAVYTPNSKYARVKLDLTYTSSPKHTFAAIKRTVFETSKLLVNLSVVSQYENKVTLRFEFELPDRNITEEEAKKELEKIKSAMKLRSKR